MKRKKRRGSSRKHRRPWHATQSMRRAQRRRGGINRRQFLTYSAGAGMLLGMSPLLTSCGDDDGTGSSGGGGPATEERTYVFDLSFMDTSAHDVILVAGKERVRLEAVTDELLANLRRRHPILEMAAREHLTHVSTRDWPADAIQLCYVQRIAHSSTDGSWDMALMFHHLPISALMDARARRQSMAAYRDTVPVKWANYGMTAATRAQLDDPVGEDMVKDPCDQATTLTVSHPELTSMEPNSAAHIQTNIVGTQSSTQILAQAICEQGPATADGGWATQTKLVDPDTGETFYNSCGQIQYVPVWSDETQQFAGKAISPAMTTTKNDTTLGANVTDLDAGSITDGDPDAPTNGAVWTLHDGIPSVDQSDVSLLGDSSLFDYQLTDQSTGHGYYAKVTNVDDQRNVTVMIKNWFVRYLGFYARYLDADDNPISLSEIEDELKSSGYFPLYGLGANGQYDAFIDLLNPEFVLFGMPVGSVTVNRTIPLPEAAAAVEILCSGWGTGSNPYPDTIDAGKITTIVVDMSLPALFLALAAAAGFSRFQMQLQATSIILQQLPTLFRLFQGAFLALEYDSPTALIRVGVTIGTMLLTSGASAFVKLIAESIAEGELQLTVEDAVPFVGNAMAAIGVLSLISQITQTSVEVALSPRTYATKLTFTHDVEVTIKHDPNDPAGFPATATYYIVTATFDQGTPQTKTQQLPATTTDDQHLTFAKVPYGGMVTVNVGFYSDNKWLAGNGSVGPVENVSDDGPLSLEITITENLVPLESDTKYSHKEIIVLDAQGNHQWEASTKPPAIETVQGACESADGQLCSLAGITVSTINAAVGYAWQSYNSLVRNCVNPAVASQQHTFANISVTQNPQSEYLFSGCGFSGTARIAYDLLGKKDWNFYLDPTSNKNLIRQVRLSGGTADFDGPMSNKAWGKFQFASDAMLLHPAGRVISINSSSDKIEVLELGDGPVADADAPASQVYSGTGIREGLLDGPTLAALTPDGTILVLETKNNRIQAFDLGANPVPMFMEDAYYVPLHDQPAGYLDLAVEYTGYMYVLSYTGTAGSLVFRLDIYTPEGDFLARTTGFEAGKLAVNYWRDLFALNYQVLKLPSGALPGRTEPSVSHWIPSTPSVTG
jgi:hypothetical protein